LAGIGVARERVSADEFVVLIRAEKDDEEGDPPDEIVGKEGDAKSKRDEIAEEVCVEEANWAEDFA